MELRGKVAVVTGASQGIGEAAARAFAAEGCGVVLAARSAQKLDRIGKELGKEALVVPCDVTSWPDILRLANATRERFGRCDVLVNNAGVGYGGTLEEMSVENIDETLAVNLRGVMLVAKALLPLLQPGSTVLNIASVAGKSGSAGLAAYCASKAGVRIFSEALGAELAGRGIRVVSVCPGYVATAMVDDADVPMEQMVQPADLAQVLVRLATQPRSAYVDEVSVWPRELYGD
ncbi:MAG: SDR family oxidoreductase [Halobacteriales archaeon]|nr:SDR family oxidoreductase [Halobacteriales archaeon]